jgi:protein-export membrane protein SecD
MFGRALVVMCVVARGSHDGREPPAADKSAPHRPILRIVYDLDLDKAIDDKLDDVRRDLDATLIDRNVPAEVTRSPTGVTVTVREHGSMDVVDDAVASYHDMLDKRRCNPAQQCYGLSPAYEQTVKKAALASAVQTIRARIDEKGIADPSVTQDADQIVVELPADNVQSAIARALIARVGKLEFKVVDDGSDFMNRVYSHVRAEPKGDVTIDVDSWRSEDGTHHTDYYLVAQDRTTIADYLAKLATNDPRFRIPDDHQIAYEHVDGTDKPPFWRTYYLEHVARVTGAGISGATATTDPNSNRPIVTVDFNRSAAQTFGELTASIVGKKLAIVFDDQIRSAPIITGAIRGGRASITMGGGARDQEADRDALVDVLKTGALPAPLHEVSATVMK